MACGGAASRARSSCRSRDRGVDEQRVRDLVAEHTTGATLGIFGKDAVNVVELNMALDEQL